MILLHIFPTYVVVQNSVQVVCVSNILQKYFKFKIMIKQ